MKYLLILFFFYLARFKKINLALLVAFSGIVFIVLTIGFHQINPGARGSNFIFGFPRVIFEFFLGVGIYQFYNYYKLPHKFLAYGLFALVAFCFFSSKGAVALVNTLIFAPLLIGSFAKISVSDARIGWCKFLGDISYPLYVTHFPLYRLLYEASFMQILPPATQTLLFSAIAILVAVTLVKIDESVRNSLKQARLLRAQNS